MSNQLVTGEVLGIDEADGTASGVEDDDVINAAVADGFNRFGGEGIGENADRGFRHVVFDQPLAEFDVVAVSAGEVAVGKNATELIFSVENEAGTGTFGGHFVEGILHAGLRRDAGEGFSAAHDVGDAGEEGVAEGAAGMKAGEVFFVEAASF